MLDRRKRKSAAANLADSAVAKLLKERKVAENDSPLAIFLS
jgi:hypothetical protein